MYNWNFKKINLKFNTQWTINGGSANNKTNDFVIVSDGNLEGWGEISSSTKNNDLIKITDDLKKIKTDELQTINSIYNLNVCPQVLAGFEMAWIHLQSKLKHKSISEYLEIKPVHEVKTSMSIPILSKEDTIQYITDSNISKFPSCKLKIKGMSSLSTLEALSDKYQGPIRVDANESFKTSTEVLDFIKQCKGIRLELIEQPLHRENISEAKVLKLKSPLPIIGDESIQNEDVNSDHINSFHGLNIKLMKSGGYKQAIKQLDQCQKLGLKTMVGCMVETSLNISSAINICANCDWVDLDGHLLLENDPFTLLVEENGTITVK